MEIWIYNQYSDKRVSLTVPEDNITIGRDDTNSVTLQSPFVSRKHARIFMESGSFFIECLGVSGLVVANRELPVNQKVKITYGDEIRVGEFSLYMMQPSTRRVSVTTRAESPRRRVIAIEQEIHSELLDRLNLRVTGQVGSVDEKLVALVKRHVSDLVESHRDKIDRDMGVYIVREYLWRSVIMEISRRSTGKLMYSYGFEDTDLLVQEHEKTLGRIVGDIIGAHPLQFRRHTLKDDVEKIEASWESHLEKIYSRITPELYAYIVHRLLSRELEDVVLGYGPLQDLLEMPNVNEIMVVGKDKIYIEKDGVLHNTGRSFFSTQILESIIERIITPIGRRIDRSTPLVDARLPDGSRVHAVINPISLCGPTLTIRKFASVPYTIDDLIEWGTLTKAAATFLRACVHSRKNILISGGTASGKTTTLNVLSNFIPDDERIITIEDSAELQLHQDHLVSLETRPPNIEGKGAYRICDLVKNSLRMRPDRIIVGEVRGPEALDMLQAMNTGHDGSLSTIHANNPDDTLLRLETMVLMAVEMPIKAIREQICAAIDMVVQIARMPNGERRVTHVSEIIDIDPNSGKIVTEDIFSVLPVPGRSDTVSELKHSGYLPEFIDELIRKGFMDIEVFT